MIATKHSDENDLKVTETLPFVYLINNVYTPKYLTVSLNTHQSVVREVDETLDSL